MRIMTFLPWLLSSSFLLGFLLLTVEWLEGRTTVFIRAFVSSPPQHRRDDVWHRSTARIDDAFKKKVRRKFSFVYLQNHDDHDTDNAIDTDTDNHNNDVPVSNKNDHSKNDGVSSSSRRSMLTTSMVKATTLVTSLSFAFETAFPPNPAAAQATTSNTVFTDEALRAAATAAQQDNAGVANIAHYQIKEFTLALPNTWNVITKYKPDTEDNTNTNAIKKKTKNTPTLFSAIDFKTGSVISVVEEQACSVEQFAQSSFASASKNKNSNKNAKVCDFVLQQPAIAPSSSSLGSVPLALFSDETYQKDARKLLLRHDDRDNAVLQGISTLETAHVVRVPPPVAATRRISSTRTRTVSSSAVSVLEVQATTTLPSGGTYRDTMGLEQPNTIDRKVVAKAYYTSSSTTPTTSTTNTNTDTDTTADTDIRVISIWLSSPVDEWQKPVMNIKLNQIWDSVTRIIPVE